MIFIFLGTQTMPRDFLSIILHTALRIQKVKVNLKVGLNAVKPQKLYLEWKPFLRLKQNTMQS